jgi:phosphoribosylamine--glycine ligase
MLTANGPRVVEFNCRFGDPETQAVLPSIGTTDSIADLLFAVARGDQLPDGVEIASARAAVTTVVAAAGYPDKPRVGNRIIIPTRPGDVLLFHAGTKRGDHDTILTAGGRVLSVTGLGDSLDDAQRRSQEFATDLSFDGKQFRTDIGWRELARRAGAT